MVVGSHNSFTYLQAKNIIGKLTSIFWRCQKLNLDEQLAAGIRCFDVRIRLSKAGNWEFAHGIAVLTSASEFYNYFEKLNENNCCVRIVFEDSGKSKKNYNKYLALCVFLEETYPNITFFEGRVKGTWEKLYHFIKEPIYLMVNQPVASMCSWYGKIFPKLWDWFNHKKSRKALDIDADYNLFDFITEKEFVND